MIDRERVIKDWEAVLSRDPLDAPYDLIDETLELLKGQEAVKSRKGQWVPIESPTGVEAFGVKEMTVMNMRCSVCGSEEDVSFTGYKYCPRCGAKMEGR